MPRRGFCCSGVGMNAATLRSSFCGFGAEGRDWWKLLLFVEPVLSVDMRLLADEPGRSMISGGGVGGKTLRWMGGSDCWRDRLTRPGLTRLRAA